MARVLGFRPHRAARQVYHDFLLVAFSIATFLKLSGRNTNDEMHGRRGPEALPAPLGQRARHTEMERYAVPMDDRLEDFSMEGGSDIDEVDNEDNSKRGQDDEDSSTPILIFGAEDALTLTSNQKSRI